MILALARQERKKIGMGNLDTVAVQRPPPTFPPPRSIRCPQVRDVMVPATSHRFGLRKSQICGTFNHAAG